MEPKSFWGTVCAAGIFIEKSLKNALNHMGVWYRTLFLLKVMKPQKQETAGVGISFETDYL